MIELLILILFTYGAYNTGKIILLVFKLKASGPVETTLYSISMGLGTISLLIMLSGFLGLLNNSVIYGLGVMLVLVSAFSIVKIPVKLVKPNFSCLATQPLWISAIIAITFSYVLFQLINCMTPVLNGDSIGQYLSIPKHFIENHSIVDRQLSEDYVSSNLPLNLYMLSVIGIMVKSEILSQLILGWLMSVLVFLGIYVSVKRFTSRGVALLCASFFYTMPTMRWLIYSAKMDMGYLMFELCFWSLFSLWLTSKDDSVLNVSAIFLGFALGSKYHSLITLSFSAGIIFIVLLTSRKSLFDSLRTVIVFCSIAAVIGSPSYIKNLALTGDPFYPFFSKYGSLEGEGYDIYKTLLDVPRFIHNIIFGKEFLAKTLYWADSPLGFLPFVVLPFVRMNELKKRKTIAISFLTYSLVLGTAVMLSVWPFPRHILPAVALTVIIIWINTNADVFINLPKYIGWAITCILLFQVTSMIGFSSLSKKVEYLCGSVSKYQYLSSMLFDAPNSSHMNSGMLAHVKSLPSDARILALDDGNGYYVDRPFLKKGYVYDDSNVLSFINRCKKDNFTHIYFSAFGLSKYHNNPRMNTAFVILDQKDEFLDDHYRSGNQHIYRIR